MAAYTNDMELSAENLLPSDLIRFLKIVVAGKDDVQTSGKIKRLVISVGKDLCHVMSEGKWMFLCVTYFYASSSPPF